MTEDQLTNLLGALALAVSDAQDDAARAACGLGASACSGLVVLHFYPGTTIRALSDILDLTHSVVVRLTGDLAARGLLARTPDGADRRQVTLRLTPAGTGMAHTILAARRATLERVLAHVPPADRPALGAALSHMLTGLTSSRVAADHICRLCDEAACPPEACPVECEAIRRAAPPA